MASKIKFPCRYLPRDWLEVEHDTVTVPGGGKEDVVSIVARSTNDQASVYLTREHAIELSNWLFAWAHGGNRG